MKTEELLNAAKKTLGIGSDYALAKRLGTSTARIGQWRTGKSTPDEQACFQLADILGIDPAAVIALVKAERETEPTKAAFWRMQAGKYAAALGVLTMLNSGSVAAAIGHGYTAAVKITAVCIMRNQG
ncbi:helix-turn-helix domain-containing protein [Thiothrix sp.]|jgi:transcriptional regulator with XRE-family HTH domain|uniref:helix-turn-helix domain-containing protein n=1 Tax=Thiothrix sp. TaxID=1032 RepID=UPI00257D6A2C|nr:helix-turn-helix domain-containing protein [Thiothrix sp.]